MKLKNLFFVAFITLITTYSYSQVTYKGLSNKFIFKITSVTIKSDKDDPGFHKKVYIDIFNKKNKKVQRITYYSGALYDSFKTDSNTRSYITGKDKNTMAPDNDFGDIVIADLNFDKKEDFAIKYHNTVSAGPTYLFYIQDKSGHFKLDHYLSNNVKFFPEGIYDNNKTITTSVYANVHQTSEQTYKFNPRKKKWRFIKRIMVEA